MVWVRGDQRNPSEPEVGYYALRIVKGAPEVAAMIVHSVGVWHALINGEPSGESHAEPELADGVQRIWLFGRKIDQQEYNFLIARYSYYKEHEPDHPFANPEKPVNRRLMPPLGG